MASIIDTAETTYPIPSPDLSTTYEISERANDDCNQTLKLQKFQSQSDFEEYSIIHRIFNVLNHNYLRYPIKRTNEDYSKITVKPEMTDGYGTISSGVPPCLVSFQKHTLVIEIGSSNQMTRKEICLTIEKILKNEELMERCMLRPGLEEKAFIIQGFDTFGAALAKFLVRNGAICIGIKDEDVQIYDPQGLDLDILCEYKQTLGSLKFYTGALSDSSDAIYKEQSDILIFSADHKSLSCYTAEDIKAMVIIEASDNAKKPMAPIILKEKSQLVVPDIYSCPGANVASYVGFLWNLQKFGKLDNKMLRTSDVNKTGMEQYQLEDEEELPAQTGSPLSAIVNHSIINRAAILDTLQYILAEKKLFNYTDLFSIGTDIRAATLIIGINNIFKSLYQHKRFF